MTSWRNDILLMATIILLALAVVFGADLLPVQASGGGDPMPLCDPIGMGGGRIVYRCIDEQEGKVIYLNDLGFMFALDW